MTDKEQQKSWSEQLPNYIDAARIAAGKIPIILIDGSKFDQDAINKARPNYQTELGRQVSLQMEEQLKGSGKWFKHEDLGDKGNDALIGAATSTAGTAQYNFILTTVPSPDEMKKLYNGMYRRYDSDHLKEKHLTFEMYIEYAAAHEVRHAFEDGNGSTIESETFADMGAINYIRNKYGAEPAQELLDQRILDVFIDKHHATSFFIQSGIQPKDITGEHFEAIDSLLDAMTDIAEEKLALTALEAIELKSDDPQKYAKTIKQAIQDGLPEIVDMKIYSSNLRESMAEKLKADPQDVPGIIDDEPERANKAYEELKAEGITKVPSLYTNPYVVKFMEQYIEAIQRTFKEDTTPKPKEQVIEEDKSTSFRNTASEMLADQTSAQDKKQAIEKTTAIPQQNSIAPVLEV